MGKNSKVTSKNRGNGWNQKRIQRSKKVKKKCEKTEIFK
jgi:hypothetical protein